MQNNSNLYQWLMLALTPKIGPVMGLKLLNHFGGVNEIFEQDLLTLSQTIPKPIAEAAVNNRAKAEVEQSLKWLEEKRDLRHIMCLKDENYPSNLATIATPPLIIYMEGNLELITKFKLAIVGTRHPTHQGIESAHRFAKELSNNNLTIVSGMALGIDRHAHLGGLQGNSKTIGVIGTGINLTYPASNKDLYTKMLAEGGLIISEFPLNTPPHVSNFPRRNRIIAGLTLGTLVVESDIDGGSMISANYALEMGREVMAIPGSIYSPVSRGCHKLISSGAKLVENINHILEELNLNQVQAKTQTNNIKPVPSQENPESEHPLLQLLGYEPITIDQICEKMKIGFSEICALLLKLELEGRIINRGHGLYQKAFN
jgi:DNA processing protein